MQPKAFRIVLYAVVAVVAVGVGYAAHRLTAEKPLSAPSAAATADDVPAAPKALPEFVPEFSLHDRDNKLVSIKAWQGKSLMINFWATWCGPCRREIPLLKELQKERADKGLQIVGVAVDFRDDVLKFADEMKIDYPILIGEQDALNVADAFGIRVLGFPFTVFADNRGRVVLLHMGELTRAQATVFLNAVDRVNKGELTPTAARAVAAEQLAGVGESAQ